MRILLATLCLLAASSGAPIWAQDDGAGLPRVRPEGPGIGGKKGLGRKGAAQKQQQGRFDALERMTPEEQERFLNSLPAPRRAEARRRLEALRRMTPDERAQARRSLREFRLLPTERQARIRELFSEFNQLPLRRRVAMRREVAILRKLDPAERRARIDAEEFRGRFSASEHRILSDLAELLPRAVEDVNDDIEE